MGLFKNTFEYGKDWEQNSASQAPKGFAAKQHKDLSQGVSYSNTPFEKRHLVKIVRVVFWLFVASAFFSGFIDSLFDEGEIRQTIQQSNIDSEEFAEDIQKTIEDTVNKRLEESAVPQAQ